MPKTRSVDYLEQDEIRAVINAVKYVSHHVARDALLLELMWQSGARVSEAVQLKVEHIGPSSVVLRNLKQVKGVEKQDNGTKKLVQDPDAIKEVEVSKSLCTELKRYCKLNKLREGHYVFQPNRGSQQPYLSRWYVWSITQKAAQYAQVFRFGKRHPSTGGRFKAAFPHLFRHSNAMKLLEETGDISIAKEQLGHSLLESTQVYAYAKRGTIRRKVSQIDWGSE